MEKATVGGVVVAIVLSGIAFFSQPEEVTRTVERVVEREVGVAAGPEKTGTQYFRAGFTVGNSAFATSSTASAYTLTSEEVDADVPFVSWNAGANISVTLPASTSAPFVGLRAGESFEQLWYNATSSTATTITFAAGTGVDLQEDEGGTVVVNGLEAARVTYVKKEDGDVLAIVEPYQVGD